MLSDLRRSLFRSPGQAFAVWASTAVWLAVAPAYLSLLGVLKWKSLPFPAADRIVQVNAGLNLVPDLAKLAHFEAVSSFEAGWVVVEGERGPATVLGAVVGQDFFHVFGTRPLIGRVFTPGSEAADAGGAVLSESCSRRLFGNARPPDRAVFRAGDRELAVLGVVRDRPAFPPSAELWFLNSSRVRPDGSFLPPKISQLGIVGRLAPGTTLQATQASVQSASREIEKREETSQGDVEVVTLQDLLRRRARGERGILAIALGGLLAFVVLVYSSTLAGFLAERQGEFAIRMAFGARRLDLIRILLLQIAVLAVPGFLTGVPAAIFVLGRLSDLVPFTMAELLPPRVGLESLSLSIAGWVVAVLASTLGVWLPSEQSGLRSLLPTERPEARKLRPQSRIRLTLVCAALSLAVTLGAAMAVLWQSLENLQREPLGFEPEGAVSAVIRLSRPLEAEQLPALLTQIGDRIGGVPGVAAVSFSNSIPFASANRHLEISLPDGSGLWLGRVQGIHGEYLRAMDLRLIAGREISRQEQNIGATVALLDERSARELFGGLPPLGGTILVGGDRVEIVGIVPATKGSAIEEERRPQLYLPLLWKGRFTSTLGFATILRLSAPIEEEDFYEAVRSVTGASASQYRPISEGVEASLAARRLARDMAFFQWLATLVLVALATFGTFSWLFKLRSFELAMRLALGDTEAGIFRRILRSAFGITATAVVVGLVIYIPTGGLLRAMLFGVDVLSPVALLTSTLLVGGVALGAATLAAKAALRRLSFDLLKTAGDRV